MDSYLITERALNNTITLLQLTYCLNKEAKDECFTCELDDCIWGRIYEHNYKNLVRIYNEEIFD